MKMPLTGSLSWLRAPPHQVPPPLQLTDARTRTRPDDFARAHRRARRARNASPRQPAGSGGDRRPRNCCARPIWPCRCRKSSSGSGSATGVDRAHIFLIDAANGEGHILQHYVWTAPGLATPPEFQNAKQSMANVGLKSWISRLERGETIVGHVRDFDPEQRAFFELGGVKSILVRARVRRRPMAGHDRLRRLPQRA